MESYCFGGLKINSSIALTGLRPFRSGRDEALAEVQLSHASGPAPDPERELFRWPGRYGLGIAACGAGWLMTSARDATVLVSGDGRALQCFDSEPAPSAWTMDFLVRRVLPRVALLHHATVIHAAAVSNGGDALLMLGASGAGKSTLSAALARNQGWNVLSDDMSVIGLDDTRRVWPAASGICVWPDSSDALALPPDQLCALPGYEGKARFTFENESPAIPNSLRALVVLCRSSDTNKPSLRKLSAAEGLVMAARQLVRFNPVSATESSQQMQRLAQVTKSVASYALAYPRHYEILPEVGEQLRHALNA